MACPGPGKPVIPRYLRKAFLRGRRRYQPVKITETTGLPFPSTVCRADREALSTRPYVHCPDTLLDYLGRILSLSAGAFGKIVVQSRHRDGDSSIKFGNARFDWAAFLSVAPSLTEDARRCCHHLG